jgi:hypothetical protein
MNESDKPSEELERSLLEQEYENALVFLDQARQNLELAKQNEDFWQNSVIQLEDAMKKAGLPVANKPRLTRAEYEALLQRDGIDPDVDQSTVEIVKGTILHIDDPAQRIKLIGSMEATLRDGIEPETPSIVQVTVGRIEEIKNAQKRIRTGEVISGLFHREGRLAKELIASSN